MVTTTGNISNEGTKEAEARKAVTAKATPKKTPARKTAADKAPAGKVPATKASPEKQAARKEPTRNVTTAKRATRAARKSAEPAPSRTETPPQERRHMIAVAAYLKAEQRGFAPGHEVEDWTAAEKEIDTLLSSR